MSVLDRAALEDSPLADLHSLASELGIDGFRRLRKADLIDKILAHQGGEEGTTDEDADAEERPKRPRRRRTRKDADADADADAEAGAEAPVAAAAEEAPAPEKPARRGRPKKDAEEKPAAAADRVAEGTVELLGNGSGFLRVSPPDPSDDDVYISAAQVRRCELVSGDRVSGPVRAPRRSERYPSLVRVDTINGRSADEVAEGTHFDDLPAAFPSERIALGSEDATLKAIEWLTPIGRGSRAVIAGGARAGKTETLRRLADALAAQDGIELTVVLTGARPEELAEWRQGPTEPASALTFAASHDAQSQAAERAVETAKRIAARGGDAVVLIDSLDGLNPHTARKVMAAARDIVDGGSLTIVATATEPIGGETTVIALDGDLTSTRRFPAIDLVASGTLRPELLVGEAGADAIAQARKQALGGGNGSS
jgi:transcription termination factor Rho